MTYVLGWTVFKHTISKLLEIKINVFDTTFHKPMPQNSTMNNPYVDQARQFFKIVNNATA